MVFGKTYGNQIVRSYSGPGTADTIYVTEDGRQWLYNPGITPQPYARTGAGNGVGYIIGDRIVDG